MELSQTTEKTKSMDTTELTEGKSITEQLDTSVNLSTEVYQDTAVAIDYVLFVKGSVMYIDDSN